MTEPCKLAEMIDENRRLVGRIDALAKTSDGPLEGPGRQRRHREIKAMQDYQSLLNQRIHAMLELK